VPLEETIRGCRAILNSEDDALPEAAFYMIGAIDQAVAKARKID
jgi:F-type H+-transporting ATPase subunit beta